MLPEKRINLTKCCQYLQVKKCSITKEVLLLCCWVLRNCVAMLPRKKVKGFAVLPEAWSGKWKCYRCLVAVALQRSVAMLNNGAVLPIKCANVTQCYQKKQYKFFMVLQIVCCCCSCVAKIKLYCYKTCVAKKLLQKN